MTRWTISADGRSTVPEEIPKPYDPYAVPEMYRAAYDAAIPEPYAYFEQAVLDLARERSEGGIVWPEDQEQVRKEQLPEVVRRAEHLSRITQAIREVSGARKRAEREAAREKANTCPICRELRPPIRTHFAEYLPRSGWKACSACAETARRLWSDTQPSKAREKAVRAALSL